MNTWVKKALSPTRENLGVHIHQNGCSHKSEYAVLKVLVLTSVVEHTLGVLMSQIISMRMKNSFQFTPAQTNHVLTTT